LLLALRGFIKRHHRLLIQTHLSLIDAFDASLAELTKQIEACMLPFEEIRKRLDEITGIGRDVATVFISEMGADMSHWPRSATPLPGGPLPRPSRERRQAHQWSHAARQPLDQAGLRPGRLGGLARQGTYMQAHFNDCAVDEGPRRRPWPSPIASSSAASRWRVRRASVIRNWAETTLTVAVPSPSPNSWSSGSRSWATKSASNWSRRPLRLSKPLAHHYFRGSTSTRQGAREGILGPATNRLGRREVCAAGARLLFAFGASDKMKAVAAGCLRQIRRECD